MLGKSITINLIIIFITSLFIGACTTTPTEEDSAEQDDVVVNEPEVAVETTSQPANSEPRLEDLPTAPSEHEVEFKASAPEQYTVVPGDTLWDLSSKFLVEPWYWPEIWHVNPQINNPHLIYPGDVITLFYVGGKPYLTVGDGPRITGEGRLKPSIRAENIDESEYAVPINAVAPFIIRPRIVTEDQLEAAPYILGSQEERLAFGSGDRVYVRGLDENADGTYIVFRPGEELLDPISQELLGFEAIMVGDGDVKRLDDPSTFDLREIGREALVGDRLLAVDSTEQFTAFVPRSPSDNLEGHVISLFDAISRVGSLQVITVNLGDRDGIEKGHVLELNQAGRTVRDPYYQKDGIRLLRPRIELPEEYAGVAMVFQTFEKVSYALIMDTEKPITVGDVVRTPN